MSTYQITSIHKDKPRGAAHSIIVSVQTSDAGSSADRSWTLRSVLDAMNRAERFYTEAPNGRRARVQRYECRACKRGHIRTHISDIAIHGMELLPHYAPATFS